MTDRPTKPERAQRPHRRAARVLDCWPMADEVCECCGEPATRWTLDGVPLCDADYAHLREHWQHD